jgi:hypothetical protein
MLYDHGILELKFLGCEMQLQAFSWMLMVTNIMGSRVSNSFNIFHSRDKKSGVVSLKLDGLVGATMTMKIFLKQ